MVLLGHLSSIQRKPFEKEAQIVEIFAGAARISRLAKAMGLHAIALDKDYCSGNNKTKSNCMDVNTSAGFLFLGFAIWSPCQPRPSTLCRRTSSCCNLRLHCAMIMEMAIGDALFVLGICCSTWVLTNRGTSKRCDFVPLGTPLALSTYKANKMTSRPG